MRCCWAGPQQVDTATGLGNTAWGAASIITCSSQAAQQGVASSQGYCRKLVCACIDVTPTPQYCRKVQRRGIVVLGKYAGP